MKNNLFDAMRDGLDYSKESAWEHTAVRQLLSALGLPRGPVLAAASAEGSKGRLTAAAFRATHPTFPAEFTAARVPYARRDVQAAMFEMTFRGDRMSQPLAKTAVVQALLSAREQAEPGARVVVAFPWRGHRAAAVHDLPLEWGDEGHVLRCRCGGLDFTIEPLRLFAGTVRFTGAWEPEYRQE